MRRGMKIAITLVKLGFRSHADVPHLSNSYGEAAAASCSIFWQRPLTLVTQRFAPCSHASRRVVGMRELLDHQRRRGDQARDTHDRKDLAEGELAARKLGYEKGAGNA